VCLVIFIALIGRFFFFFFFFFGTLRLDMLGFQSITGNCSFVITLKLLNNV
jgi:hypothetical protein